MNTHIHMSYFKTYRYKCATREPSQPRTVIGTTSYRPANSILGMVDIPSLTVHRPQNEERGESNKK